MTATATATATATRADARTQTQAARGPVAKAKAVEDAFRGKPFPLGADDHWVASASDVDWSGDHERHIVRRGGLTTACGASASTVDTWEPNKTKARCRGCMTAEITQGRR